MPGKRLRNIIPLFDSQKNKISPTTIIIEILELIKNGISWSDSYYLDLDNGEYVEFTICLVEIPRKKSLRIYVTEVDSSDPLVSINRSLVVNDVLNKTLIKILEEDENGQEYTLAKGNKS